MKDKKTVFVLGAGASCPYGYPSGAHLREHICLSRSDTKLDELLKGVGNGRMVGDFKKTFERSGTKSIDLFMARNPKLAPVGKYIIAFETFRGEQESQFREEAEWVQEAYKRHHRNDAGREAYLKRKDFQGGDWYSYLFNRLTEGLVDLPDFSDGRVSFVTFNYDRSLEHFLYESLRNSFTEVQEAQVIQCLKNLKILHVYGQIAPLKCQDCNEGVDYRPEISEALLQKTAANIKTIYEQKESPDINEALRLLSQAGQIFFLGFGFAPENMGVLRLPGIIPQVNCHVYGTALGLYETELKRISNSIKERFPWQISEYCVTIEAMDCLDLLRVQV
jgi:hypothetical protein